METNKPNELIVMSEFLKEIIASLRKTSTERISNPFYGVFILTWLVFNWEAVAILLFSDLPMQERVRFINSAYSLTFFYPLASAVFLTFALPWCTEKITFFQSKSISRTSSLLAVRKKKMLTADISVERFRPKKDVAYERYRVGSEKEIQSMRESIIESTERTGQLTKERDDALEKIRLMEGVIEENHRLGGDLKASLNDKSRLEHELQANLNNTIQLVAQNEHYKKDKDLYFTQNQRMHAAVDNLVNKFPGLFYRDDENYIIKLKPEVVNELAFYNEKAELGGFNNGKDNVSSVSMVDSLTVYPGNEKK